MNVRYVPSILPDTLREGKSPHPSNWMDPRARKAGACHPHALLSPHYWPSGTVSRAARPYGLLMGDSGGYQVVSRGVEMDPVRVLSWQLQNVDFGPLADFPPDKGQAVAPRDRRRRFHYALLRTVSNTRRAAPLYRRARTRGTSFRWMGVVHGASRSELAGWWEKVREVHDFGGDGEGWAFRPVPRGSPEGVARVLGFCRDRGIERIHLFVPGGPPALATLLALGPQAGITRVTFDNSSPITLANNRGIFVREGDGLGWTHLDERPRRTNGRDRRCRDYLLRKCDCASCGWYREEVLRASGRLSAPQVRRRMRFHNVLVVRDTLRALQREARREPEGLLRRKLGRRLRPTLEAWHGQE